MQIYLDNKAKRGLEYKYPIKAEDLGKIPRFNDSPFRYFIIDAAYKLWRIYAKDKTNIKGISLRKFQKLWKSVADEVFSEMEENLDGVELPEQMGIMYLGTPPNKTYFNLVGLDKYKYVIWGSKIKYFNKRLKYYFFHTTKARFKSAYEREDYYKTAKEKISSFKLY